MDACAAGLSRNPFERNAELDDACLPNTFAAQLSELQSGLRAVQGVTVLVAAGGSGKSVLAAAFARRIDALARTALLAQPTSSVSAIARDAIAQLDESGDAFTLDDDWVGAFRANVTRRAREGGTTVLLIDDAHRLSPQTLDDLAGLFADDEPSRLHVVLFGRPRLLDRMEAGADGALHALLLHSGRLDPLGVRESVRYLERRLAFCGGELTALFTDEAIDEIVQKAGGRMMAIEELASRSLARATRRGAKRVVATDVMTIAPRAIAEEEEGMARHQQPLQFQLTDEATDADAVTDEWTDDDDQEGSVEWGEDDDDGTEEWHADDDEDDDGVLEGPALRWESTPHRLDDEGLGDDLGDEEEAFAPLTASEKASGRRRIVGRAVLSLFACLGLIWAANHLPGPASDAQHGRDSMLSARPLSSEPKQILRLAATVQAADADAQVMAWRAQPPREVSETRARTEPAGETVSTAGKASPDATAGQPEKTGPEPQATAERVARPNSTTTAAAPAPDRLASKAPASSRKTATVVAKPASKAVVAATSRSSSVYTVQLGAFKTRSNAEELATRLRGKPTRILREGGLYRVMSGSFSSKRDASVHEASLRRAGYTTFVRTAVF